ncbi:MAG: hypothetical protein Q9168_001493 [Polycauliona sp. 1 TL-2023]
MLFGWIPLDREKLADLLSGTTIRIIAHLDAVVTELPHQDPTANEQLYIPMDHAFAHRHHTVVHPSTNKNSTFLPLVSRCGLQLSPDAINDVEKLTSIQVYLEEFGLLQADERAKHNFPPSDRDRAKDSDFAASPKFKEMQHQYFLSSSHGELIDTFLAWQARDDETLILATVDPGLRAEIRPLFFDGPPKPLLRQWVISKFLYKVWLEGDFADDDQNFARYWKSRRFVEQRAELLDTLMGANWTLRLS